MDSKIAAASKFIEIATYVLGEGVVPVRPLLAVPSRENPVSAVDEEKIFAVDTRQLEVKNIAKMRQEVISITYDFIALPKHYAREFKGMS